MKRLVFAFGLMGVAILGLAAWQGGPGTANYPLGLPTGLNFLFPTLTISSAGNGNGAVALSGNTSGAATLTAPAAAGTPTPANPVVSSNWVSAPGFLTNGNVSIQDEFCGYTPATTQLIGEYGWDKTVIVAGTNPIAAVASVANHPCLITLTTNTTATNGVGISLGPGFGILFPGNSTNWTAEWIQEINQVATGSYRIGFGTVDAATAIPTNGIYFRFLNGTDTFINACFDVAGSESAGGGVCTATTIAPTAADYVDLFMTSSTTGKVTFTVQDITTPATSTVTICPSGCTAAGTAPTGVLSPMFSIVETGSSVADVLTVDYFGYQQTAIR